MCDIHVINVTDNENSLNDTDIFVEIYTFRYEFCSRQCLAYLHIAMKQSETRKPDKKLMPPTSMTPEK